ncbi:MAG: hypothetical protein IT289_08275 [Oligoflexia bacterium]|nr:hypothetical protein [Oligoflexia bacterium]
MTQLSEQSYKETVFNWEREKEWSFIRGFWHQKYSEFAFYSKKWKTDDGGRIDS